MRSIRVEIHRTDLIDRLNKLGGNEMPVWGKMNAGRMMSHLVQAGDLSFVEGTHDGSAFITRTFLKRLALYFLSMPVGIASLYTRATPRPTMLIICR